MKLISNLALILEYSTVPSPDMGSRAAVGRPRTYHDHTRDRPSVSTQLCLINSKRGRTVDGVQIRGRQTDITECKNVSMI